MCPETKSFEGRKLSKLVEKHGYASGRAATFMLELSEDDVAVTRLSFKEAKDAYRVVRDTRNASKTEDAGYKHGKRHLHIAMKHIMQR